MARGSLPRLCSSEACGRAFVASDTRQRYCSASCGNYTRQRRRRHAVCAQCHKAIDAGRFCDQACRGTYVTERRSRKGKRVIEPMAVLLPSGCNPKPMRIADLQGEYGEIARRIYCRRYERCLSYAVSKNWGGFGCKSCDVQEPEEPQKPGPKRSNWEW